MAHTFHPVQIGTAFGWHSLALWGTDFGGPSLALEQCRTCSALKCTTDEGAIRFVSRGNITDIEPDCES